nr:MAG TPA: hypothetical protein [Caudoviricetes sp.]
MRIYQMSTWIFWKSKLTNLWKLSWEDIVNEH